MRRWLLRLLDGIQVVDRPLTHSGDPVCGHCGAVCSTYESKVAHLEWARTQTRDQRYAAMHA